MTHLGTNEPIAALKPCVYVLNAPLRRMRRTGTRGARPSGRVCLRPAREGMEHGRRRQDAERDEEGPPSQVLR